MSEFALPDVGEGLTEAVLVSWRVAVGDTVDVNDVLAEIETAKSLVELPSPFAGEVSALLVSEGDTVDVGTPIISVDSGVAAATFATVETAGAIVGAAADRAGSGGALSESPPMLVGYGPRADDTQRRSRVPHEAAGAVQEGSDHPLARPLAKPPVRKLAKDLGVELFEVPSAGETVTREEVEAFAGKRTGSDAGEVRIPVAGVRKLTAEAMVRSAFTAPHVTEWITLDVSRTVELVASLKGHRDFDGVRVTPMLIVARAICLAMRNTPELNARWDEDAQEIVLKRSVNLGIAVATQRGLMVPNIVDADRLPLAELARAIGELTATARAGRTPPGQMTGGTVSLTNIGVFGIDSGTPILNPGEAGIVALGSIERRPWVDADDRIVPRWVTTLALSFDHRVVDGEQGSRFLADVAAVLREPGLVMTY